MGDRHKRRHAHRRTGPRGCRTYDEVDPILGPWKASTTWHVVEHEPPRRSVHTTRDIPLQQPLRRGDGGGARGGRERGHDDAARRAGAGAGRGGLRALHAGPGRPRQPAQRSRRSQSSLRVSWASSRRASSRGAAASARAGRQCDRVLARGPRGARLGARDAGRRRDRGSARDYHRGARRRRGPLPARAGARGALAARRSRTSRGGGCRRSGSAPSPSKCSSWSGRERLGRWFIPARLADLSRCPRSGWKGWPALPASAPAH